MSGPLETNPQPHSEDTIVDGALELPPEERQAFLDKACGPDARLRQLVEGMLRAHQRISAPRPGLAETFRSASSLSDLPTQRPGDRIGAYKILQQIGEGGYGVVYMAEQEEPVRRRVALKVIKLGMDTKQVIARFEAERQALALMDHPNIAKVLDAGATEAGRPFFVMELVRGIKITDYCDQNNIPTRERLGLFVQVCGAIQHAHQKGIIHRDIKPSNVLVTLHDGVAVPKVIDFGIAKAATGQPLTDKTVFTAFEQFIGTPAYMSPEQAEMSGLDIDTRSDIYALGVLLYELLTGKTPFDAKRLVSAALDELRRIIREEEPPRPSTRISTLDAAEQTTVAKRRQADAPKLVHLVRGDLDWIVMRCLEKDRSRRYETANGLAQDVQRFLSDEPVAARPPSHLYRFQKLARRNRIAFAAAGAVALSLVVGLGLSTWLFLKEKRAREFADRQARRSEQVALLLEDALTGVGPSVALGQDTTLLRGIMDRTTERIAKDLQGQPELEAELCDKIGEVYRAIGEFEKAEAMHRRARALQAQGPRAEQAEATTALDDLALVLRDRGNFSEAEALQREILDTRRKMLGNENTNVAITLNHLGLVLRSEGKLAEAENLHRQAFTMETNLLGQENLFVAVTLNGLALTLQEEDKLPEAETKFREALRIFEMFKAQDPTVGILRDNLASVLRDEGRLEEAEKLETNAVALLEKLLPPVNKDVATALSNEGLLDLKRGDLARAYAEEEKALNIRHRLLGEEHPEVANSLENLALTLRAQVATNAELTGQLAHEITDRTQTDDSRAKLKEAEGLELRALAMRQKLLGPEHVRVARAYDNLGLVLRDEGRSAEAEDAFRKALVMERKALGDEHRIVAVTFEHLVNCLAREHKAEEIETVADGILTPEMGKTPQAARLERARDAARAVAVTSVTPNKP